MVFNGSVLKHPSALGGGFQCESVSAVKNCRQNEVKLESRNGVLTALGGKSGSGWCLMDWQVKTPPRKRGIAQRC